MMSSSVRKRASLKVFPMAISVITLEVEIAAAQPRMRNFTSRRRSS
jgi:hypothetical protein